MPAQIDIGELLEAAEAEDGSGVCLACGEFQHGCEPDARNYECECCGENRVFGASEAIIMIA